MLSLNLTTQLTKEEDLKLKSKRLCLETTKLLLKLMTISLKLLSVHYHLLEDLELESTDLLCFLLEARQSKMLFFSQHLKNKTNYNVKEALQTAEPLFI